VFFVNILKPSEMANVGALIPGLPGNRRRIPGLGFADDLVLLSDTLVALKISFGLVVKAIDILKLEMNVGPLKSALMGIGPGARVSLENNQLTDPIAYMGEILPVVLSYKYLGSLFTDDLDLLSMANARAVKGHKTLMALQPVISNPSIPLAYRCRIVKMLLGTTLTWGGEIWGCNQTNISKCQTVWGKACLSLLRLSHHNTFTTRMCVGRELGLFSIQAKVYSARARVWLKFPRLRTVAHLLFDNLPTCRKLSWFTGAHKWFATHYPIVLQAHDPTVLPPGQMALDNFLHELRCNIDDWVSKPEKLKSMAIYTKRDLESSNLWVKYTTHLPSEGKGFNYLARLRTGSLYTVSLLMKIPDLVPVKWRTQCPCCHEMVIEDVQHLMLDCEKWKVQRELYLSPLWERLEFYGGRRFGELPPCEKLDALVGARYNSYHERIMEDRVTEAAAVIESERRGLLFHGSKEFWSCKPTLFDSVDLLSRDECGNLRRVIDPNCGGPAVTFLPSDVNPVFLSVARYLSSVMSIRRDIIHDVLDLQEPMPQIW